MALGIRQQAVPHRLALSATLLVASSTVHAGTSFGLPTADELWTLLVLELLIAGAAVAALSVANRTRGYIAYLAKVCGVLMAAACAIGLIAGGWVGLVSTAYLSAVVGCALFVVLSLLICFGALVSSSIERLWPRRTDTEEFKTFTMPAPTEPLLGIPDPKSVDVEAVLDELRGMGLHADLESEGVWTVSEPLRQVQQFAHGPLELLAIRDQHVRSSQLAGSPCSSAARTGAAALKSRTGSEPQSPAA